VSFVKFLLQTEKYNFGSLSLVWERARSDTELCLENTIWQRGSGILFLHQQLLHCEGGTTAHRRAHMHVPTYMDIEYSDPIHIRAQFHVVSVKSSH
jgi:hypothetical protein